MNIVYELLFHPLKQWFTWFYNDIPINQCQIFRASSKFYFLNYYLISTVFGAFIFYSHYAHRNLR